MALRVYISQNENEKVGVVGNWYARVDNLPPIGIDELAGLVKEHNIGFSRGSIKGIIEDAVAIIRSQVLMGQPVKLDNLAIFKASVENKGGWADLKDVSLRIGGDKDNIQAIRLLAQATGDFTKAELSKDGRLVLDRQSAALVAAAGGNPDGNGGSDDNGGSDSGQQQGGSGDNGGGGSGQQTTTGYALTISKSGTGTATVSSGGNTVNSGASLNEDAEVELSITPAEGQVPTATINGSDIELTESDGTYTGSFAMPAQASTLTINTGTTSGGDSHNPIDTGN